LPAHFRRDLKDAGTNWATQLVAVRHPNRNSLRCRQRDGHRGSGSRSPKRVRRDLDDAVAGRTTRLLAGHRLVDLKCTAAMWTSKLKHYVSPGAPRPIGRIKRSTIRPINKSSLFDDRESSTLHSRQCPMREVLLTEIGS
jgi:hypothetical protein